MFEPDKYDDVRVLTPEELKKISGLKETEFLLKVRPNHNADMTGFMSKLNKNGTIPHAFSDWGQYWSATSGNQHSKTYLLEEKYRRNWKFRGLRHGQSTAWAVLLHPYGFTIEINANSFAKVIDEITMINGVLVTPCYFNARAKNAELLVEKDDGKDFFYSLVHSVTTEDTIAESLMTKFEEIMRAEHPDKVFTFFSNG